MSVLNTLLPAEHIFSSQTEREESSSELGVCMRVKVVKGLWVCEEWHREGMDAEVCICDSSKTVPHDWCGSVCKRKGRDLCACEERGGTREILSVCVSVSTCTRGFPPFSFCMYLFKKGGFKGAFQ